MGKPIANAVWNSVAAAQSADFERDLTALMPNLRIFSRSLCSNATLAEDIAQQALMKAWRARDRFEPGTNLKAWLFTILRHEFYSNKRRSWREVPWDVDLGELVPAPANEQEWALELSDATRALGTLPQTQQDALILVAVGGLSFQDAAKFSDTPLGTMKSRVTRARRGLTKTLEGGKSLPRRAAGRRTSASDDILAQLSALSPASSNLASCVA